MRSYAAGFPAETDSRSGAGPAPTGQASRERYPGGPGVPQGGDPDIVEVTLSISFRKGVLRAPTWELGGWRRKEA
jgi:hypothetical protein